MFNLGEILKGESDRRSSVENELVGPVAVDLDTDEDIAVARNPEGNVRQGFGCARRRHEGDNGKKERQKSHQ